MHSHSLGGFEHDHVFLGSRDSRNERRLWLVGGVAAAAMAAEIAAGVLLGSMALLADGLHMATHVGALGLAAAAYAFARRRAADPRFAFGTGKVGDLAAFTSAVVLGIVALLIGWESLERMIAPSAIDFQGAVLVAVLGLAVNLVSAWLLHDNAHDHEGTAHSHDHNHRAAFLHVLADALTSVLAILALLAGGALGWTWLDPLVGVVGAAVIARWSLSLAKEAGAVLLDAGSCELAGKVREVVETKTDRLVDLHVWRVGPGHNAAIVSLVSEHPLSPAAYKARLEAIPGLCHVTIEVHSAEPAEASSTEAKEFDQPAVDGSDCRKASVRLEPETCTPSVPRCTRFSAS